MLDRFSVASPPRLDPISEGETVAIVDTNNPEELSDNIEKAEIVEIIDHHKLFGGLTTSAPIKITMAPVACTATLIWRKIQGSGLQVDPGIAGLMLSAIVSDTLKFTSPTTTEEDKEVAQALSEMCKTNIDELADNMFAAKSDLAGMSARDILNVDSKVFEFSGKKVRISVLETTNPDNAKGLKDDIEKALQEIKNEEQLDYVFFFVINIVTSTASLLITGEEEGKIAQEAFDEVVKDSFMVLPGVVSRKKQIVPAIEKAFASN